MLNVANPIPDCTPDSPEWAFRAVAMINERDRRIAEMEASYNALREAVAWERECEAFPQSVIWNSGYFLRQRHGKDYFDSVWKELRETGKLARAEVERLLEGREV